MSESNAVNIESIIEFLESIGFEKDDGHCWADGCYRCYLGDRSPFEVGSVRIFEYGSAESINLVSVSRIDLRLGEAKVKAIIKVIIS